MCVGGDKRGARKKGKMSPRYLKRLQFYLKSIFTEKEHFSLLIRMWCVDFLFAFVGFLWCMLLTFPNYINLLVMIFTSKQSFVSLFEVIFSACECNSVLHNWEEKMGYCFLPFLAISFLNLTKNLSIVLLVLASGTYYFFNTQFTYTILQ